MITNATKAGVTTVTAAGVVAVGGAALLAGSTIVGLKVLGDGVIGGCKAMRKSFANTFERTTEPGSEEATANTTEQSAQSGVTLNYKAIGRSVVAGYKAVENCVVGECKKIGTVVAKTFSTTDEPDETVEPEETDESVEPTE